MKKLPEEFKARMRSILGSGYDDFIAGFDRPPVRGLRVNTLRLSKERFMELSPWTVEQADTLDEGLILKGEAEHIGTHPYHLAGLFYIQEPSAMSVIETAQIAPGMRVLDLCAAPGGKSGGAAARLRGSGVLVANEIVPSRARLLAQNLERLGISNAVVTCARPDAAASAFPGYFDRVLVDAPCSGEGMFRKDDTAISEWSPEHVAACAVRQRAILESAAECTAVGGKLIYSTCTFSHEENEGVIDAFLSGHPEFELECSQRLYPHTSRGEGHFSARLFKCGAAGRTESRPQPAPLFKHTADKASLSVVCGFLDSVFAVHPTVDELFGRVHITSGGRALYVPFDVSAAIGELRIISLGTEIGQLSGGRLKPSHSIFMCADGFEPREAVDLSADAPEMRTFLSGNVIAVDASLRGCLPVRADGYTVGFGKAVDGMLKNHIPKGLTVASYR